MIASIAHEIGHILTDYGHPDENDGSSALPSTNHRERMMHSGYGLGNRGGYNLGAMARGHRFVKAEWDDAEVWLAKRPNGDN